MARLQDVADLAGVSIATASRALRAGHAMRAATRQRVLTAAATLDYRPRERGRTETEVVAVLSAGAAHRSIGPMIDQITSTGATCSMLSTSRTTATEADLVERLVHQPGLRGVIVVGGIVPDERWRTRMARAARRLRSRSVPLVFCGRGGGTLQIPGVVSVDYDQAAGARLAVDHLVRNGHRTIGLVRGPAGLTIPEACTSGFLSAVNAHRLPWDSRLEAVAPVIDSAADAVRRLLAEHPGITALFCTSDVIAIGAMNGVAQLGRTVPHDVSVVGFDDMFGTDRLTPPLTTVRVPWNALAARTVARTLAAAWDAEPEVLRTELVVRESVRGL